jgi:hypothetical protein
MRSRILAGRMLIRWRVSTKETGWGMYPEELAANTDCRKFSDIFRQVLSGTSNQREELSSYLEMQYRKGKLVYGLHASPTALLTCLIFSYNQSHIHLVDGGNGGYALAAAEFKERMRHSRGTGAPRADGATDYR